MPGGFQSIIGGGIRPEYALHGVYETIRGEPLDKRNFRKAILALGKLEPTGRFRREGAHRPAMLYRLKIRKGVEIIK